MAEQNLMVIRNFYSLQKYNDLILNLSGISIILIMPSVSRKPDIKSPVFS